MSSMEGYTTKAQLGLEAIRTLPNRSDKFSEKDILVYQLSSQMINTSEEVVKSGKHGLEE